MRTAVLVLTFFLLCLGAVVGAGMLRGHASSPTPLQRLRTEFAKRHHVRSVDHSKFAVLQAPFATPQDVTAACLSCHTGRGTEVMASSHWNWARREYVPGRGIRTIGKKNVINNFCIGVSGNLAGCDKCHAGYGYVDATFDFSNANNIDCLACHDNTNTYERTGGGVPLPTLDLNAIAQNVGRPLRANCGTCHFFGGGGNNVKHGDLEEAMFEPSRELDVHMASDGANLQCVDCHRAENHKLLGKMYSLSSMNRSRSTCEQCHTNLPHADDLLNEHTIKVACQTCHVPEYARGAATKMAWDWSTAGRLRDGKPYEDHDTEGNITYASIKGTFTWASNVTPDYVWFNGTASHYLIGDKADPSRPIPINTLLGSYDDPDSKIVPVKVHRARQIFDPVNGILIQPKLVETTPGDGGFWKEFDWDKAAAAGMKALGLPYSGQYSFVSTEMTWPLNHQVAPREKTVGCSQCHTREGSRLAGLRDFYLPGRDRHRGVDTTGAAALLLVLGGVLVHGTARFLSSKQRRSR